MKLAVGAIFRVFGVLGTAYPYRMARFEERWEAIGSERSWSEVEPADWNVSLTYYLSIAMAVAGAGLVAAEVLL